jgi:lysophospholipase L1-like esterase
MYICCFGDSLTLGVGDAEFLGWPGRVARRMVREDMDVTLYNLGVRRNSAARVQARWAEEADRRLGDVPEGESTLLLFSFGAVDALREADPDETLRAARDVLGRAREKRPALFISPPPVRDKAANERVAGLSGALAGVCADLDLPCLDVYTPLASSFEYINSLRASDGVHPTGDGHGLIADLVWDWSAFRERLAG